MTRRASIVVVSLVIAGLVAVALMIVPSSPIHKKPTLGLDLQGGLEITKEAVPPKGRKLTKEDLSRSVTIMRDRVDRLGVSEPEIRTQGNNQITIQLPGVKDPEAAAKIIGKTAQLELFDLETSLVAPSIDINGNPQPRSSVYDLLAGQQAIVKDKSDQWWVFDKKKKLVVGPVSSKEKALAKYDGELPAGYKLFGTPNGTVVISCGVQAVVCPGVGTPTGNSYYLFKYDPPDVPQMTGGDLKLSGTRQDFDTTTNQPIVSLQFTNKGSDRFQEITRSEYVRGKLRNAPQHFAIVLDREIRSWPQIDYTDGALAGGISGNAQITGIGDIQEAKDLALVLQTGALPVEFVTLDQTAISATLGKDSLEPGEDRRDRRPVPRRALPAHLLPLPRPHRGARPRHLRRLPLRRDPHLQRDADPPGLRRPRADAGGGRRRERRHLRTHQGRGARGAEHPGRDPDRIHEGLRDDRRRQRRHRDHRPRAVRGRHLLGARIRPHAPDRYRDLDAHCRARDARVPVAARRLEAPRQPARDRHLRWRHPAVAQDRLHQPAAAVVRDLGRRDRGLGRSRSASAGSTSASTSRAAPRSASRRPPRPRSRRFASRRPRSARRTP